MSRIDSMTITYSNGAKLIQTAGPARKQPKAGDEKYVKSTRKTMIRQQAKHGNAYMVNRGKPVWEWVEKGSDRDRCARTTAERQ